VAIAPERVAELIRLLAESRHNLAALQDEVEGIDTPLARLYALEMQDDLGKLEEVFESVHRLASALVELRNGEG
jgi:hypothetical protein